MVYRTGLNDLFMRIILPTNCNCDFTSIYMRSRINWREFSFQILCSFFFCKHYKDDVCTFIFNPMNNLLAEDCNTCLT